MENIRLLLASVALVFAVISVAIWWIRGRQRSVQKRGFALVYSILLFVSAILLYSRAGDQETAKVDSERDHVVETRQMESRILVDSMQVEPESVVQQSSDLARTASSRNEDKKPDSEREGVLKLKDSTVQLLNTELRPVQVPPQKPLPRHSSRKVNGDSIDEVVEASVIFAFDAIERFFGTYGSPVSSQKIQTKSDTASREIEFLPGTAELTSMSKNYLRSLAPELKSHLVAGHIEIHSQTDESLNSPAERLSLTQSRAEAVMKVLAAEGIPAERLIPVGNETAGQSCVSFVHRPN